MNAARLLPVLPPLILAGAVVLLLLAGAFRRGSRLAAAIAPAALLLAALAIVPAARQLPWRGGFLLRVDSFSLLFFAAAIAGAAAVLALARSHFRDRGESQAAFDILLLLATLAAALLPSCSHFVSFFVVLEILSVSLYALLAFRRVEPPGIEAAIKYLILASTSTAFLLFGMALIYAAGGALEWAALARSLAEGGGGAWQAAGLALVLVGAGFKLALVPFHMWTPDVYQGAPAPVTALVASVSKGAMFAFLLRLFAPLAFSGRPPLLVAVGLLAAASMLAGNLLALLQNSLKRLLAYSSIAHMGYMTVALLAGGAVGTAAAIFYLLAYMAMILGAFAVVVRLSTEAHEADALDSYAGLALRRPWLGAAATLFLFALAGIPLTAAFLGKFYILRAAAGAGLWWLAGLLALGSLIGVFVYLRVVLLLFAAPATGLKEPPPAPRAAPGADAVLAVAALLVLLLGLFPGWLLPWIRTAVAALGRTGAG